MSRRPREGFNTENYLKWALSERSQVGTGFPSLNEAGARIKGQNARRRSGGPRRACANCGRMNHVALKVCRCGRVL